ncbi:MAG: hypothetical protein K8F36_09855 [Melioribacteraceae bacterium]|nr:hypothetical protein [Melioribacteraceae bacterium]
MRKIFAALFILLIPACSHNAPETTNQEQNARVVDESKLFEFKFIGPLSENSSELSGLDWYGDQLFILPQFPFKMSGLDEYGYLYFINKSDILNVLNGDLDNRLNYNQIKLFAEGLEEFNSWGSGYEAIAFKDDKVYLTIESLDGGETAGYIVTGIYHETDNKIVLEKSTLKKIDQAIEIFNYSEESLLVQDDKILSIYEANGSNVNPNPVVNVLDPNLIESQYYSLDNIEYRITDASQIDSSGNFWVINYFWPGDHEKLKPADDIIITNFGVGKSHKNSASVERIINLQILDQKIVLGEKNPVYLELQTDGESRNWEGLAKLDDLGFLMVTDKFPKTILAFVPFPTDNE